MLVLAWQALTRSASLALSWATALYFGSVPGNKGRLLSIMALLSAGWVIVAVGFGVPLLVGFAAERIGLVERNFSIPPLAVLGLSALIIAGPPLIAAIAEFTEGHPGWSPLRWLRRLPVSYPGTASLGLGVLQMVAITPFLLVSRVRHGQRLLQVPLVMQAPGSTEGLAGPVIEALESLHGGDFREEPLTGPISWPLRTVGYAAQHLLGRIVSGEPQLIAGDGLQVIVYATDVGILGPDEEAHRARAAIEKRLAFTRAFLTWSPEAQRFEEMLRRFHRSVSPGTLRDIFDRLQEQIDGASLTNDEWNLLYRLRLQLERAATVDGAALQGDRGSAPEGHHQRPDEERQPDEEDEEARAPV